MNLMNDGYINLSEVKDLPHSELFRVVGEVIREENLDYVNAHSKKVCPKSSFYSKYGKRVFDFFCALIALIIVFPINLILLICTFFDVGVPLVFKQKRVGKNGELFYIIKFRNMTNETNEHGELLPPYQRVTEFGKFVRRTSLDELLNFWSILRGDMSLIGPRPLLVDYYGLYSDRHRMRHAVRPGLECPVISPDHDRSTWSDWFENDIYYVENVSFFLDLKMLFALLKLMFSKKEVNDRGKAIRGSFMGYEKDGSSITSTKVPLKYYEKAFKLIKEKNEINRNNENGGL